MTYPGGKSGAGVFQAIINQLPPHAVYVEPFAGYGGVLRNKRPAARSMAFDLSDDVAAFWRGRDGVEFHQRCGLEWLTRYADSIGRDWLIYCDPPYLLSSRRSQRSRYEHELGDLDHAALLSVLKRLRCMVAISGYQSALYEHSLADWRCVTFQAATRGGGATEYLWCNYPAPTALHDWSYVGTDYRERENVRRMSQRWAAKVRAMAPLTRQAVMSACMDAAASADRPGADSATARTGGGADR